MNVMSQPYRLSSGGKIDRIRPIPFKFNGRSYQGFEGDTLASALLANGVRVVGRSMKLHRPRGILSAGVEEPNALVSVGEASRVEPNVRATMQPLYEGLVANSQNCWPSVDYDVQGVLAWFSAFWSAGFYNKTFMWPNWSWYEDAVRAVAGIGKAPTTNDPDTYFHKNVHCDVLVCGGGAAGVAAASVASASGARVFLLEQDNVLGHSIFNRVTDDQDTKYIWLKDTIKELYAAPNVTVLTQTTASGVFDHRVVAAVERVHQRHDAPINARQLFWRIRAKKIIFATGAIEQPLVFPNNDRPGVMLASAVVEYVNRYAVCPGKKVVIATNNDSAYSVALALKEADCNIVALLDSRSVNQSTKIAQTITQAGVAVHHNSTVIDADGAKGLRRIKLGDANGHFNPMLGNNGIIECDCLAMSGGWQPTAHLFSHARGALQYDHEIAGFAPKISPEGVYVAGAVNGAFDFERARKDGARAGGEAVQALGLKGGSIAPERRGEKNTLKTHRNIPSVKPGKQWIDFQHDVTLRDIDVAVREDYVSVEHLKRYTTNGMSVDQGKTSNLNAIHALAERTNRSIDEVGVTTYRPFYTPVTLGAIAGRRRGELYAPTRYSPLHDLLDAAGGEFWDYGQWKRPAAYPTTGESLYQAMQREAKAVRRSVGLYDGSPLGKIEVRGADAAAFLNKFYINNVLSLKIGRARYGIMLNEKGIVLDDGIFARLGEAHFLVHTTSANAARILAWMEEWRQCEWFDMDVLIRSVTPAWANVTISGPNAREVLQAIGTDIDLSNDAFPHMSIREGTIGGEHVPVRIMRASFTGELGYEVNVPARFGAALWRNLMVSGRTYEITPYGLETLMTLRSEKGYLHIGADTDGATVPDDIGWGGPASKKKGDFIGKRSLLLPENTRQDRRQFVGIEPLEGQRRFMAGAHIINADKTQGPSEGYVTSAFYSPHLSRWLGLALVTGGRNRVGETINLYDRGSLQAARLVEPTAQFDADGERLHV